jgi:hypothetical protein
VRDGDERETGRTSKVGQTREAETENRVCCANKARTENDTSYAEKGSTERKNEASCPDKAGVENKNEACCASEAKSKARPDRRADKRRKGIRSGSEIASIANKNERRKSDASCGAGPPLPSESPAKA